MRSLLTYPILLTALILSAAYASCTDRDTLQTRLLDIISDYDAETGIAVIIDGQDTVTVNNYGYYPMMSVFKFHQAMAVAYKLSLENTPLDTVIHISPDQLRNNTYSPLRDRYPDKDVDISVAELLKYTLQLSDNNACDVLFDRITGIAETDSYIRSLGIDDFAISADENDMHVDVTRCYDNRTSPLEAAKLLDIFVSQPVLPDNYRNFIIRTMTECETGADRLAVPLAGTGAILGHKTGTGDRNAEGRIIGLNDIGFVMLPDRSRYTIAVFVKDSGESAETTARIIADVSECVYRYVTTHR